MSWHQKILESMSRSIEGVSDADREGGKRLLRSAFHSRRYLNGQTRHGRTKHSEKMEGGRGILCSELEFGQIVWWPFRCPPVIPLPLLS